MNQPAKAQEPSMEEILASIRRIIADDDAVRLEKIFYRATFAQELGIHAESELILFQAGYFFESLTHECRRCARNHRALHYDYMISSAAA